MASTYIVQHKQNLALSRRGRSQRSDTTNARSLRQCCPAQRRRRCAALREQSARGAGETKGRSCKYHCEGVESLEQSKAKSGVEEEAAEMLCSCAELSQIGVHGREFPAIIAALAPSPASRTGFTNAG